MLSAAPALSGNGLYAESGNELKAFELIRVSCLSVLITLAQNGPSTDATYMMHAKRLLGSLEIIGGMSILGFIEDPTVGNIGVAFA